MAAGSARWGEEGEQISLRAASAQFNPTWVDSARETWPRLGGRCSPPKALVRRTDRPHPFPCSRRALTQAPRKEAGGCGKVLKIIGKRERASSFFLFNKQPKAAHVCLVPPVPPSPSAAGRAAPMAPSSRAGRGAGGATQQTGTSEPTSLSEMERALGAGRAPRVPVPPATSGLSLRHGAALRKRPQPAPPISQSPAELQVFLP